MNIEKKAKQYAAWYMKSLEVPLLKHKCKEDIEDHIADMLTTLVSLKDTLAKNTLSENLDHEKFKVITIDALINFLAGE